MFKLTINNADHGLFFATVRDALIYIESMIEAGDIETTEAESLMISIVK